MDRSLTIPEHFAHTNQEEKEMGYTVTISSGLSGDRRLKLLCYVGDDRLRLSADDFDLIFLIEGVDRPTRAVRSTVRTVVTGFETFSEQLMQLTPNDYSRALLFFPSGHSLPDLSCLQGSIPWDAFQVNVTGYLLGRHQYIFVATYNPLLSPEITWLPLATNAMHNIVARVS